MCHSFAYTVLRFFQFYNTYTNPTMKEQLSPRAQTTKETIETGT
jgi:hypothetical protein